MTSYNDKRSIHREDIIILNVYEANNRTTKQMKQKLTEMKRETDKSIIIAGDFNTSLSVIDRKISNNTEEMNNQLHLTFIEQSTHQKQNTHSLRCTWNIHQDRPYPGSTAK